MNNNIFSMNVYFIQGFAFKPMGRLFRLLTDVCICSTSAAIRLKTRRNVKFSTQIWMFDGCFFIRTSNTEEENINDTKNKDKNILISLLKSNECCHSVKTILLSTEGRPGVKS